MDKKPFSARLRDSFAKIGFCDSTEELARKPAVIDALVERALLYADMQDKNPRRPENPSYADRLRLALNEGKTSALENILKRNIVVCLDQRLKNVKHDWRHDRVEGVFYNLGGRQILTLYDDGTDKRYHELQLPSYARHVLNDLDMQVLCEKKIEPLYLFRAGVRPSIYNWDKSQKHESQVQKHPWLKRPPLRDDLFAPKLRATKPSSHKL